MVLWLLDNGRRAVIGPNMHASDRCSRLINSEGELTVSNESACNVRAIYCEMIQVFLIVSCG